MKRPLLLLVVLIASCLSMAAAGQDAPPPPQAAPAAQKTPPPPPPPPLQASRDNVRVDVTITDQSASATPIKKTMSLVVSRAGSIRSGVNVPTTQTVFDRSQSPSSPITSYNYRTQGLSLDVLNLSVQNGRIHARMSLEYNPADDNEKPGTSTVIPVSYSNYSQTFELELEDGRPIVVAQTSDPLPSRNRTLTVEVKATILK